jgi:hypothetical protein
MRLVKEIFAFVNEYMLSNHFLTPKLADPDKTPGFEVPKKGREKERQPGFTN